MANSGNTIPHGVADGSDASVATTPSSTTAKGGSFSTGSFIAGLLTGLAFGAGLTHLVFGKGKRSKASRSAIRPEPHDEPTLVPQSSPAVDAHDGVTEVEEPTLAPAGAAKRKLTDEEVALIRACYDGGVPAREIAARLGISVKTVYSRLRKNNNLENPKQDEQQ